MCGSCDEVGHHQLERIQKQQPPPQRRIIILEDEPRGSVKSMSSTATTSYTAAADNRSLASRSSGSFHQRSLTSPTLCTRRIIFPSLYEGSKQQQPSPVSSSCVNHDVHHHGNVDGQPNAATDTDISLAHMRANSLDGILIPIPSSGSKAIQECWSSPSPPTQRTYYPPPKSTAQDPPPPPPPPSRCAAQDPPISKIIPTTASSSASVLDAPPRPRSRSVILGDVLRHRTYYPAATIPTPVNSNNNKSSPNNTKSSKPLKSILRRRLPLIMPPPLPPPNGGTTMMSRRASAPTITTTKLSPTTPTHQLSKSLTIPPICLSPSVPTLASPASIISLHSQQHHHEYHTACGSGCDHPLHHHDGISNSGSNNIGESECDLVRITDFPKLLPRSQQCTLRKIQSDTIVANLEGEDVRRSSRRDSVLAAADYSACAAASSSAVTCKEQVNGGGGGGGRCTSPSRGVSRHVSLESLGTNKRVSFDPHITVYEFGIADYEKRGGEKWWGEEELAQFKQEAIQRIRLRSSSGSTNKVILPTGTGRALAVMPTTNTTSGMGGGGGGSGRKAASTGISFNHPALRCCEDELLFDSECKKTSTSSYLATSSSSKESMLNRCLTQEIRNILVVDPHEIFLALFTKSLRFMFPHASGEYK